MQTSKQSRHKVLVLRELESICNMMETFENKYKIKCTDSVPDAIRDYEPPRLLRYIKKNRFTEKYI
jgi:hypothetical protein